MENEYRLDATVMPRKKYRRIPKPKAGDIVNSQQYGSLKLVERKGFGDWAAEMANGRMVRIQGLPEVEILRPI